MLDRHVIPILQRMIDVRPLEVRALFLSFGYLFCLLTSFTILRPLRDAVGAGGARDLQWLMTATFLVMLAAVPLYGWVSSRMPPRRFIPLVSRFFALQALVFAWLFVSHWHRADAGRVFFVWTSVFNLFVVTIFWSAMVDLWRQEAGVRLFGFITAGATAGALCGPLVVLTLAEIVQPVGLLVVSAAFLEAGVRCARSLYRSMDSSREARKAPLLGGEALAGVRAVVRSAHLSRIAAYVVFMSMGATFMYMVQARLAAIHFPDVPSRARFFSSMDIAVNVTMLVAQCLGTGRFMRRFGISKALGTLPMTTVLAGGALLVAPTLVVLVMVQTLRRAADYALAGPAREVVYTALDRELKYKATSVIETAVRRGGDAASAWLYTVLANAGNGLTPPLVAVSAMSLGWLALSLWIARGRSLSGPLPGSVAAPRR